MLLDNEPSLLRLFFPIILHEESTTLQENRKSRDIRYRVIQYQLNIIFNLCIDKTFDHRVRFSNLESIAVSRFPSKIFPRIIFPVHRDSATFIKRVEVHKSARPIYSRKRIQQETR